MSLVQFLIGLLIGLAFSLFWRMRFNQKLKRLLLALEIPGIDSALPLISRLRRGVTLANEQRQLLESEIQTWQEILQIAPCGFLMVDEENQLIWCNEQARQMLNIDRWEPGQVRLLLELVRSYELDVLIDQTRHQQQPIKQEWLFHTTYSNTETGEYQEHLIPKSLTIRATSLPLSKGRVGVFLENRQALVELSQAQNRWVSDLAHELRTPLTSIRLVAEALQDRLEPPLSRWVERLLPEVNRLISLVQDWLELSQLETDSSNHLRRQPLDLHTLICSVWQSLEPLYNAKNLKFNYFGPQSLSIEADESRLYRVFLNILDNSIKYSPEAGEIRVVFNIYPETGIPQFVEINIIDCGPGFPMSDLPYVFERLYRGDPSRKRQTTSTTESEGTIKSTTTGSGLGLAIVRQIILAHGGSVTAKNHPQTGGAWLKIELPFEKSVND
ncbi:histidine kinase [Phormidium sp. LEGE 05292]|uniref:sensor histidine kinase n=1 Tax=[Phormidium] sp. LEGE 05292 TaxID=767427 RepID=UPI00187EE8A6|nr:ATP-binding protein [Phormidium sp. LEGE 05292]MBE9227671.1 histidine kinase [Phormidium sp. LEGE 05292]